MAVHPPFFLLQRGTSMDGREHKAASAPSSEENLEVLPQCHMMSLFHCPGHRGSELRHCYPVLECVIYSLLRRHTHGLCLSTFSWHFVSLPWPEELYWAAVKARLGDIFTLTKIARHLQKCISVMEFRGWGALNKVSPLYLIALVEADITAEPVRFVRMRSPESTVVARYDEPGKQESRVVVNRQPSCKIHWTVFTCISQ